MKMKMRRFGEIKISGVSLPLYIIMIIILMVTIARHKLPLNMLGLTLMLVLLGHLFYYIGNKLPIFNTIYVVNRRAQYELQ